MATVANGASLVASWGKGDPLITRGVVHGRNRADVNMCPFSADDYPNGWTGDGAIIMRNALLYQ